MLLNPNSKYQNTSKIILGDTLSHLKELESESFNLIITSPPYNIGKEYEAKQSIEDYLAFQERVIYELVRLLNSHGSICWQVGNYVSKGEIFPLDIFYYPIFKKLGLKLRNRIIWYFGHGLHARNRFSGRYETLLWFTKTEDYIFNLDPVRVPSKYPNKRHFKGQKKGQISGNPKGKNPSDIWEIVLQDWEKGLWNIPNIKSNHPEKTIHPAQFPVELIERCILALTNEHNWVLDPFAGVGSMAIAALKNQRNSVGIEKEEKYVQIANERIESLKVGTLKLRPINRSIYQPKTTGKTTNINQELKSLYQEK